MAVMAKISLTAKCIFVLMVLAVCPVGMGAQKPVPSKTPTSGGKSTAGAKTNFDVLVEGIQFAVFSRDLNEPKEYQRLNSVGDKFPTAFDIDTNKKIKLHFTLKNKNDGSPVLVHQAFVALINKETKQEIIFVAEPANDATKQYTFELDMKSGAKEFAGASGSYSASLIVGDFAVQNPIFWAFADLKISLPQTASSVGGEQKLPKSRHIDYKPLPEIQHKFRQDEARPPTVVSDFFAALCVAPLLLLFILWGKIGLNFERFQFSLWALGFHAGMLAIFGLYTCYWLQLNMFQTLKWLALLAPATFIFGNRLFRSLASSATKKQKSE